MWSFCVHLVWDSSTLLACMSFSFVRLEKFSFTISSNGFSISCSFFSPAGTPIMWMLICLMLSLRPLELSFFLIFFSFCCSDWVFSATLSFKSMIEFPSSSSNLLLLPSSIIHFSYWISFWLVLILFSFSIFMFPIFSLKFSLKSLRILITSVLSSALDR